MHLIEREIETETPKTPQSKSSFLLQILSLSLFLIYLLNTMSTTTRKKLRVNRVSVDLGCNCRRPKLSFLFNSKSKGSSDSQNNKKKLNQNHHSSTNSIWEKEDCTPTTTTTLSSNNMYYYSSPFSDETTRSSNGSSYSKTFGGFGRTGREGVAIEKDSEDPYLDFRHSMLQMILENEIYSKDDLKQLLNCFLSINSPSNHGIIIRAFTEIWNGVFSFSASSASGSSKLLQHFAYKSREL